MSSVEQRLILVPQSPAKRARKVPGGQARVESATIVVRLTTAAQRTAGNLSPPTRATRSRRRPFGGLHPRWQRAAERALIYANAVSGTSRMADRRAAKVSHVPIPAGGTAQEAERTPRGQAEELRDPTSSTADGLSPMVASVCGGRVRVVVELVTS